LLVGEPLIKVTAKAGLKAVEIAYRNAGTVLAQQPKVFGINSNQKRLALGQFGKTFNHVSSRRQHICRRAEPEENVRNGFMTQPLNLQCLGSDVAIPLHPLKPACRIHVPNLPTRREENS